MDNAPIVSLPAQSGETASTAIAAQAKAMVESRYIMAMRNPRSWDAVRQELIRECHRPAFANNPSTWYVKPIGKGVEGLGIRFVEVALRCMKNVLVETTMIFEDETKEVHRVSVTDLEANVTYPLDVRVSKTVERSKPDSDGSYISVRKNSYGRDTYTVIGTDDDLLNKRGALISKAIRTLGLRIIPGDLCDEASEIIKDTRLNSAAQDPSETRKKLADAFALIGVSVIDLTQYLGHDLAKCSPAQLVQLRGLYGAIKDGETSWKSVMDNQFESARGGQGSAQADDLMPSRKSEPQREPAPRAEPQERPAQAEQSATQQNDVKRISRGMLNSLRAAMDRAGIDDAEICEAFKVDSLESLAFSDLNQALALCKQAKPS